MRSICLKTLGLFLCILWLQTQAADGKAQHFDIPGQELAAALKQFAVQSDLEILFVPEDTVAKRTVGVRGEYAPTEALKVLLAGTGLQYRVTSGDSIVIENQAPDAVNTSEANSPANVHLAQSETGPMRKVEDAYSEDPASKNNADRLDEIVVTAQKREERLIDVPISIVALGAQELEKRNINGIDDLSSAVPGLAVQNGSGQRRITLRGISNFTGSSSLIGLYLDEASVTSATPVAQLDLQTYDLERVEVIRGPQGTLYGEGSVGGTVRFITNNPRLDRFAMNGEVSATFTEDGSPGERVEAALNVPVVKDQFGLRIAGTFDQQGGWMDQPAAGREDFNEQKLAEVRVKGLWQPTERFTANAMAVIHRNDTAPNNGEDANGNFNQTFNQTTTPDGEDDYEIYNLTVTYDLPAVRILNTASYIQQERQNQNLGYRLPLPAPPAAPFDVYISNQMVETDVITEEFRLTSLATGPWQWTLGAFYRNAEYTPSTTAAAAPPVPPGAPVPAAATQLTDNQFKSWAVFGNLSYQFTERLTLGTGLRYFEDDQEYAVGFGTLGAVQTEKFDAVNPRFYAQYKLTDRANVYASAAKGFRSGGFNSLNQPAYEPESVWTYELGTKMSSPDSRLSAEASVFYTDYTDYQIGGILPPPAPLALITSNVGSATVKGVEVGLAWYPVDHWSVNFTGSYVDSAFYEINAASTSHSVGDPLDLFPKYGYSVSTQRDFNWNGKEGFARLDYNQQGRSSFRNRRFGTWYFSESDVINMLNFNVGMQWNDSVSVGLFARNIFDDRGLVDPMSIQEFAARSRPRTFGVNVGISF